MPAINPRLTITLKPSTAAILRTLSELTGNSQSGLIAELLEANEDTFSRLIAILQAADAAKTSMSAEAAAGLKSAQDRLENQLGLTLDAVDEVTGSLLNEAEKVVRRARKRGDAGAGFARPAAAQKSAPTPISNRGVRSTPRKTKDHKKGDR